MDREYIALNYDTGWSILAYVKMVLEYQVYILIVCSSAKIDHGSYHFHSPQRFLLFARAAEYKLHSYAIKGRFKSEPNSVRHLDSP